MDLDRKNLRAIDGVRLALLALAALSSALRGPAVVDWALELDVRRNGRHPSVFVRFNVIFDVVVGSGIVGISRA